MYVSLPVCLCHSLSVSLSVSLGFLLSLSRSISRSLYLSIYLLYRSIYLSICLSPLFLLPSLIHSIRPRKVNQSCQVFFFTTHQFVRHVTKVKLFINNQSFQDSIPKWYVPIYALTPADLENQI